MFPLPRFGTSTAWLAGLLAYWCCAAAVAQPSVVRPAANFTLEVNGAPFYPLGWNMLGTCPEDPDTVAWGAVVEQMEWLRDHGTNTILEPGSTGGRFLPRRVGGRYLWQNFTYSSTDGTTARRGHPRPGAYVAGMRRLMDLAYYGDEGDAQAPIFAIVPLHRFIVPEGESEAVDGSEVLRCQTYAEIIEDERQLYQRANSELADFLPPVACADAGALPYWEWNIRYIVQSLRDHPGLLAWYLWDEPEGPGKRHLFGIVPPDQPVPEYTGPASLPTPDLLRYAYDRVIAFENEGRVDESPRHPVIVDLYAPHVFFSDRFSWSVSGERRPADHAGPFDRTPVGNYRTPADILGIDASGTLMQTAARGDEPAHGWYWDPNIPVRKADMLRDAIERDSLWSALVVAGQGQLSSRPPFALAEPIRCTNPKPRLRLLNDRDLVWHLLTLQAEGLKGFLYYARNFIPVSGPGAEQIARTDRLVVQFLEADLDHILSTPRVKDGWRVSDLTVEKLTNYYRSDPMFVGPAEDYDPGLSAFSQRIHFPDPSAYRVANFNRHAGESAYGHVVPEPSAPTMHENHQLLRTALHRYRGNLYLFVSNAFDARITADLSFDSPLISSLPPAEARFDLDSGGRFAWAPDPSRLRLLDSPRDQATLRVALEPYEARVFRIQP